MGAFLAFLASPAGSAAASFLMSEAISGVNYLTAITSGQVTLEQAMAAWEKGSNRFNEGDKAVGKALGEQS